MPAERLGRGQQPALGRPEQGDGAARPGVRQRHRRGTVGAGAPGLGRRRELATLLISHDLSVVHAVCDEVAVMRDGVLLERAPVARFFRHPGHPYSRALLDAVPRLPGR